MRTVFPRFTLLVLACLALSLVLIGSEDPQAVSKPYSRDDIIYLLLHDVPPKRIAMLAQQRGIDFECTPDTEGVLRAAGATDDLLSTLRELRPELLVQSTPGNASVYVDGELAGTTGNDGQLKLDKLRTGSRMVRVTLAGYRDFWQTILLIAGRTLTVRAKLEAAGPPKLIVQSTPAGAQVYIDGRLAGSTNAQGQLTIEKLSPGTHQVQVSAFLYANYQQDVKLAAGDSPAVTANLSPADLKPVTLHNAVPMDEEVTLSPDGRWAATWDARRGDGTVKIWGTTGDQLLWALNSGRICLGFSADGTLIATTDSHTISVSDVATGKLTAKVHVSNAVAIAFTRDHKFLVTLEVDKKFNCIGRVSEIPTSRVARTYASDMSCGTIGAAELLMISPNDHFVAARSHSGALAIWELATGNKVLEFKAPDSSMTAIAYSPDGRWLASGTFHGAMHLSDTSNGKEVWTVQGHTKQVNALTFTPDGRYLASVGADNGLKFWDAATGHEMGSLQGYSSGGSMDDAITFTPDGRYLLTLGTEVMRWQLPK